MKYLIPAHFVFASNNVTAELSSEDLAFSHAMCTVITTTAPLIVKARESNMQTSNVVDILNANESSISMRAYRTNIVLRGYKATWLDEAGFVNEVYLNCMRNVDWNLIMKEKENAKQLEQPSANK